MKNWIPAFHVAFGLCVTNFGSIASAELKLISDTAPQCVFGGQTRSIAVVWRNPGDVVAGAEITAQIFQTSFATAVKRGEMPWKQLQVLPQQTVLESAQVDFPAVKSETIFMIQWLESTNQILGQTKVVVYPTNLLAELKPLAGDTALGIFDPQNQIKPLLKNLKVEFSDLQNSGLETFSGRLAIVGPFQTKVQMREGLAEQIQVLAKKGAAIVWLQPPRGRAEKLSPSFYPVPGNTSATNAIVIVQPELVSNLADNPQAQLNLIYFCKLALQPEIFQLPNLNHNHD